MGGQMDGVARGPAAHMGMSRMTAHAGRITATEAWLDAMRRVSRAPVILACVFVVTFLTAVPFSIALRSSMTASLGHSLAANEALEGVNYSWWTEYSAAQPA